MPFMPLLTQRDRRAELMDDPAIDPADHQAALVGLRRVNRWSRSSAIVWPTIRSLAKNSSQRPVRVLDLACGGGDVTREIAQRAAQAQLPIEIHGCDIHPFAVEYSRVGETPRDAVPVSFFQLDVLQDELPNDYDVLMCSLFLHHLSDEEALQFLRRMMSATRQLVLVNDLCRTRFGYLLAWAGCRLLTRSPIVHHDGPLSVRAAFTINEIEKLTREAGMMETRMTRHWPQRFLLSWRKD
ncbi:MAG: methyltransferase domain-containing protein, partial [Planctomycetaceae bacterium]|nr:methyltransferase domain-containing protein [Planctomycetaceae bacterium]